MLRHSISQVQPDLGDERIGGHLGVEPGPGERDDAKGAVPRVVAVGVVEHHEPARADLVVVDGQIGGQGDREGGQPLRGRGLVAADLWAQPNCA